MRAGEYNNVISIERPTIAESDFGSQTTTYNEVCKVRAHIKYGRGWRSATDGGEIVYAKSVYFTIRSYTDVFLSDVIVHQCDRYRIIAIEQRKQERETELTAELIND